LAKRSPSSTVWWVGGAGAAYHRAVIGDSGRGKTRQQNEARKKLGGGKEVSSGPGRKKVSAEKKVQTTAGGTTKKGRPAGVSTIGRKGGEYGQTREVFVGRLTERAKN